MVDICDPQRPKEVSFPPGLEDSYHAEGAYGISVRTKACKGNLLAVDNEYARLDRAAGSTSTTSRSRASSRRSCRTSANSA